MLGENSFHIEVQLTFQRIKKSYLTLGAVMPPASYIGLYLLVRELF